MFIKGPIDIGIEITSRCNLDCPYCYSSDENHFELSSHEIEGITEKIIKELHPFEISYEGGEPFIRKDIMELIRWGVENICLGAGLGFSVLTNGSLLTTDQIREISILQRKAKGLFTLQISLDSTEKNIHNQLRGLFKETMESIKNLINYKIDFVVGMVITSINISHIIHDIERLSSLKVKRVLLMNMMPSYKMNQKQYWYLKPHPRALKNLFSQITLLSQGKKVGLIIEGPYRSANISRKAQTLKYKGCSAGVLRLAIKPNGDVIPCSMLRDWVIANVLRDRTQKIWREEVWNEFRNKDKLLCYERYAPAF